jgi:hypothetical protein
MTEIKPSTLETPEEVLENEIEDLEKHTLNSGWLWAAAAVGLVVLAGAAFIITSWDNRSQEGRTVAFTPEAMSLLQPKGTLDGPLTFRWGPIDNASTYIVLVKSVTGDEVELLRPVHETYLTPSDTEQSNLLPGTYTWSVEARSRRGTLIGYGEGSFDVAGP